MMKCSLLSRSSRKTNLLNQDLYLESIQQQVLDPSPTVFTAALYVFGLTALFAHHLYRRHRLQNHFLIVGICIGVFISSVKNLINPSEPLATDLRKLLPWSYLMASLSSVVAHWWIGGAMVESDKVEATVYRQTPKAGGSVLEKGNVVET